MGFKGSLILTKLNAKCPVYKHVFKFKDFYQILKHVSSPKMIKSQC